MIRLTVPSLDESDFSAVRDTLASGFLVQGAKVSQFEQTIADYVGTRQAVAVTNCTAALHLALLSLGVGAKHASPVGPGDIVVVTSYSWVSTANVIELCGAQPVFTDVDPRTFDMDPDDLSKVLDRLMSNPETARRVKAVMPVHTFGLMADMPRILDIAGRYDLRVIEDAACALGARIDGRQAGSWGVMGCFSFHPRKAITTGEGGIVTTDCSETAARLKSLRNHGLNPDSPSPDFLMPGFNCRMTEFQAALGSTQMAKLDRILAARCAAAARYDQLLSGTSVSVPFVPSGAQHVYQSYVILLPTGSDRDAVIQQLRANGVEATIGTWHMPMTGYFRTRYGYRVGDFPNADDVFARAVTLPLYETITAEQQETVAAALADCGV